MTERSYAVNVLVSFDELCGKLAQYRFAVDDRSTLLHVQHAVDDV